ncbi:Carboxypeptidase Y-like protein A [Tolypocladium capitatum]|uniref:Carboxypeptidase Y-like protein A n=1 Tax=Tolypocladium capitatum TaxID=45235 RepID=A0A2K3QJE0_9HYPO|nr:Carboxypeptidase Y-like protein A [Tolypocladium capitatum]
MSLPFCFCFFCCRRLPVLLVFPSFSSPRPSRLQTPELEPTTARQPSLDKPTVRGRHLLSLSIRAYHHLVMRLSISALVLGGVASSSAVALLDQAITGVTSGPNPKNIIRKPDSHWDHVIKGADVQHGGRQGGASRRLEGELANYNLRVKAVEPSSLGVDTVKQYSGYLDDQEQDKHLFYCKQLAP